MFERLLQQWDEVRTEYGTVERRYTQCAQTWPLGSNVKLENMESAIQLLRQACDYLYNGVTQMGSIVDQKCNTEKVQLVVSEVITQLQKMQSTFDEKSKRAETVATRVDELSGESMSVRNRLDGVERRLGLESQQQQASLRDLLQTDIQSRDQKHFELEESIFHLQCGPGKGSEGVP